MHTLLRNTRFYVLSFSLLLSLIIAFIILLVVPAPQIEIIRLNQLYGFVSVGFLYIAMMIGPAYYSFPKLLYKKQVQHSRRAMGVSACYFALLHTSIAFFGQLGGFSGIGFLAENLVVSLLFGVVALFILLVLALTSFDAVIKKMTFPAWKFLQRFVYVAGLLILIHTLTLGTHFANLSTAIPEIFFAMLAILLLLESTRFDAFLQTKFTMPRFGITTALLIGLIGFSYVSSFFPSASVPSFDIHAQHEQIAQDAQQTSLNIPGIPSLQGDKSLRYTVGFVKPDDVEPNQDTQLSFPVYNADNGNQVFLFQQIYSQQAHLVIVDNELQYFAHLHPQLQGNTFTVNTTFPHPGVYRLYLNYQPVDAIEQQVGFSIRVGMSDDQAAPFAEQKIDTKNVKNVDKYQIIMNTGNGFRAEDMSYGTQRITFTIRDAKTKKPITTLKPYLAAFGHLTMVNEKTYSYIHVHPTVNVYNENQIGGPNVTFMPLGLYGPIKPGVYRVFAEFNPDEHLIVADFTVDVK